MEPGARTLCEPWDFGPLEKLWRLIVPWKPLPFEVPEIFTRWPGLERLDGDGLADLQLAGLVAELDEVAVRAGVGLLEVAELGLGQVLLLGRRRTRAGRRRSRRGRRRGSP